LLYYEPSKTTADSVMNRVIEIRTYQLKPNTNAAFHRLSLEANTLQLGVDIVANRPCEADANSYCLIRAYESVADRDQRQSTFYASAAWREGPREAVLACIQSYTSFVLAATEATIDGLRTHATKSHQD
jgi:hypothetical protein